MGDQGWQKVIMFQAHYLGSSSFQTGYLKSPDSKIKNETFEEFHGIYMANL